MDGILVVDKPKGMTSHDVVDFIRKRFKIKKVGHAGTLDPMATGVLVLLLGGATKLSSQLMSDDKAYEVILRLGITTDTCDAEGKIQTQRDTSMLNDKKVRDVLSKFCGELLQTPPPFSAVKYKGIPSYKLARRGILVTKEPRKINIKELVVKEINIPEVLFRVHCSKGTYVRQLCSDIGEKLGCGGHMTALRRVRSGDFRIEGAVSFKALKEMSPEELNIKLSRINEDNIWN